MNTEENKLKQTDREPVRMPRPLQSSEARPSCPSLSTSFARQATSGAMGRPTPARSSRPSSEQRAEGPALYEKSRFVVPLTLEPD